jgi:hypothetical protein
MERSMAKKQQELKLDNEFKAMDACIKALKTLTQVEVNRVVQYLQKRFVDQQDFGG